jgi:hypothetical protein
VQALGQCLFLPMIMLGGVGIPLAVLPLWAQRIAGFMPGRYAVEVLQRCISHPLGLHGTGFSLAALAVIGVAAGAVGMRLFRWESGRRISGAAWAWVAGALMSWVAVGVAAGLTGRLQPVLPESAAYESITAAQIDEIAYDDLPGDSEFVARLAPPFSGGERSRRLDDFGTRLRAWPPGRLTDAGQSVRNLVCVATIADVTEDPLEGEVARAVFNHLQARFNRDELAHALAWIVLYPDDGSVINNVPELGFTRHPPRVTIRSRSVLYAKKYLGRALGKIRD